MKTSSLDLLEKQLPPGQARAILQVMDAELGDHVSNLATKRDLEGLRRDLEATTALTKRDMEILEGKLRLEIEALRGDMKGFESRLMRWNFAFWVGQAAATFAIIKWLR